MDQSKRIHLFGEFGPCILHFKFSSEAPLPRARHFCYSLMPPTVNNLLQTNDKNQEATVYIGNLDEKVTESLIWEVMLQAGPIRSVHIPRDRITQSHQGYAFCEFSSELDADYAVKVMNQVRLWGKPIKVNRASADKRTLDIGANLFVGNLAPEADEKMLFDSFGCFGTIITAPTVARDPATNTSRGFGFVSFDSFEAADAALEAMNSQYLCNRPISVSYAFKKDGNGERHGSPAERLLAAQAKKGEKSLASTQASSTPQYTQPQQYYQMMMPYMNQGTALQPGMMPVHPQMMNPHGMSGRQMVYPQSSSQAQQNMPMQAQSIYQVPPGATPATPYPAYAMPVNVGGAKVPYHGYQQQSHK